jgi:hypothetical protein
MSEICDLVYFVLTDGKTEPQIAELDALLSDPRDKEAMIAKQNEAAMRALGGHGFIGPPRPRRPSA